MSYRPLTSELQSNEFFVLSTKLEHVHMGVRLVKIPFRFFFFFFRFGGFFLFLYFLLWFFVVLNFF